MVYESFTAIFMQFANILALKILAFLNQFHFGH